jgi:ribosome recycling factor
MKELIKNTEEKMNKTVAVLERDYKSIRAGRANAAVLDRISVDYYGVPTPVQQMAAVSTPEPRVLMIQPWDATTLKTIEKAILTSDIGINPQNDGSAIRLSFPPMTEERRRELSKQVSKMGEDAKVAVRNIRRDANDKLKAMKKDGEMTEDEAKQSDKAVQDLTDKYVKELDLVTAAKTKEIMEI